MQQQQPVLSTQDFNMAADIDPQNADVYHHRGQVSTVLIVYWFYYVCLIKECKCTVLSFFFFSSKIWYSVVTENNSNRRLLVIFALIMGLPRFLCVLEDPLEL